MNIQAEKIELIKQLADVDSESVLKKIRAILSPGLKAKRKSKTTREQALLEKVQEARAEIKAGKGVKIPLEDLWK